MRQLSPSFSPQKILIRIPNWLGDGVMATGVFRQVKTLWPNARIDLIGLPSMVSLFERDPLIGKTWGWRAKGLGKYGPFHPLLPLIRQESYDVAILLTNSFSSAWQTLFMGAKVRIGFASEARSWLLTHAYDFPKQRATQHLVITYQDLLRGVLTEAKDLPTYPPSMTVERDQENEAQAWLKSHLPKGSPVIGLNPSAAYGPAKQWPKERFQTLARRLIDRGFSVLIFGEPASKALGEYVAHGLESTGRCYNLSGKTNMKEFIARMASCDGIVANDSGPMHLASALKVPLVAIFGSTDDTVTGPYAWGHVIHKHVECSPCFKRVCPIDFRCMMRIEVDEVEKALLKQLEAKISP